MHHVDKIAAIEFSREGSVVLVMDLYDPLRDDYADSWYGPLNIPPKKFRMSSKSATVTELVRLCST